MKTERLPPELRSELNRLAHARGQEYEAEQRRTFFNEATAMLRAGRPPEEVLRLILKRDA
jgi:hypothetical protein